MAEQKINKKGSRIVGVLKIIGYIALIIGIALIIVRFVATRTVVDGNSMYPTLNDKDQLIVSKLDKSYSRYDIVVFDSPLKEDEYLIKRVIGLPGENVFIQGGYIFIDGNKLLTDTYGAAEITDGGRAAAEGGVTLGPDEYFVMGDNRNRSEDSRFEDVGSIKAADIQGRVVCRIMPVKMFGDVDLYRKRVMGH